MRLRLLLAASLATAALRAQTPDTTGTTPVAPAPATVPSTVPATPSVRPLTLDEAVALALDKNFDLKIQRLATDSAGDSLIIAESAYDPTLSLTTARSYSQSIDGVTSQSGLDTRIGASQKIATGATISGSGSLDRSSSRPSLSSSLNPVFNSDVSLSVRQPLLRGFGTTVNRAAINRAKLGVSIANLDLKDSVLATIRSVESAYYTLAFARAQLDVRRFSLEVAEKLVSENRTRVSVGSAIDLDVLQSEVGVANARRALLQAEQTARNAEDNLVALINPFQFAVTPGPVVLPELGAITVSFDRSYKLARDQAPDLASTQLSIEQLKLDAAVAKKNQLPTLDVGAAFGYNARKNNAGEAASDVWGSDGHNWQLDATVSLPWGLRADKARHRQALSTLNREQLRLQQLDQSILVQVRSAIRAVETNDESVRIAALATKLSEEQFEAENARNQNGRSTFRAVQEAKEDLDTARISELQARLALTNALADLSRLEASSLTRYRINLDQ
ncbi:TolC family protein [Nibricoccus aquaticus]|nr:TolC family protein [Nibricoccus aquaticus]